MLNTEDHLDNLIRHIRLVQDACVLLGKKFIKNGDEEFGRLLIARGFEHDVSKFYGIEWDYLHAGKDVPKEQLTLAMKQHTATNEHHPEYWQGIENMPDLALAECVCDWLARSQEFGTSLEDWFVENGSKKYEVKPGTKLYKQIMKYIDMLTENHFK